MVKYLGTYGCSEESLKEKVEKLKQVMVLKQRYEEVKDLPIEERISIIDEIHKIFPKLDTFNSWYNLLYSRGSEDERLKEIYDSIMPVRQLLHQLDEDNDLHKLRFERVKNKLIDLDFGITNGYFKDGTKSLYKITNSAGDIITFYDWVEVCKRLPFLSSDDNFYYYSCTKVCSSLRKIGMNLMHMINEFINEVFVKSDDKDLNVIGVVLNDFKVRNRLNVLSAITIERLISECVKGDDFLTLSVYGNPKCSLTITSDDKQKIFEYMMASNMPILRQVYNELVKQYARLSAYCNGNADMINFVFFSNDTTLSILERILVIEELIKNNKEVNVKNYSEEVFEYSLKKTGLVQGESRKYSRS